MKIRILVRGAILGGIVSSLAACSSGGLFGPRASATDVATLEARAAADAQRENLARLSPAPERSTVWDLFGNSSDPNTTLEVNKYLWQASLEVLDFLPVQSVDPFSGVIVTGFGTPPGGGRAYRATIYVQDPALDARSLKVALMSKSGPVDTATAQAVEDAILTRARELRIRDSKL